MPLESVRIDLPIFEFVAAANVAAPLAALDDGDADELDEVDELDVLEVLLLELDVLDDELFESLLHAAAKSRTALMRRTDARFMPLPTHERRRGIARSRRNAQRAGAGRRVVAATSPRPINASPLHCRRG
jgi:hypothetical protein